MSDHRPLQRLFVPHRLAPGQDIALERAQSHYVADVLRLREGEHILLIDGETGEWRAEIVRAHGKASALRVVAQTRPLEEPADLWLCFAPIKRGRIDWMIEKACELGVARVVPVLTQRTIVDRLADERLRQHMIEAAEQCGRTRIPEIAPLTKLPLLLDAWPAGRHLLFCDETGGAALRDTALDAPAAILIGPEGGFTPHERDLLRAHPQARATSLGPRILRADTAAVAALAAWQAISGDWR